MPLIPREIRTAATGLIRPQARTSLLPSSSRFPSLTLGPCDQSLCHHPVIRSSPTVANLTHQLRAFQQQHLNPLASPSTKSIQLAITAQKGIALDQDTLSRDLTLLAKEQDAWLKTLSVNGLPPAGHGVASDTASIASATTSADAALYDGKSLAFIGFVLYLTCPISSSYANTLRLDPSIILVAQAA